MSKGHRQRPLAVKQEDFNLSWERIFKKKKQDDLPMIKQKDIKENNKTNEVTEQDPTDV